MRECTEYDRNPHARVKRISTIITRVQLSLERVWMKTLLHPHFKLSNGYSGGTYTHTLTNKRMHIHGTVLDLELDLSTFTQNNLLYASFLSLSLSLSPEYGFPRLSIVCFPPFLVWACITFLHNFHIRMEKIPVFLVISAIHSFNVRSGI